MKSGALPTYPSTERNGNAGLGLGVGVQSKARANRPKSLVSDSGSNARVQSPLVRSPGFFDLSQPSADEGIDSRFFHASDAPRQEPAPKKLEPKRGPAFFYADGQQEERTNVVSSKPASPVLSAVSEQRSSGPWIRSEAMPLPSRSPPMLSPALSSLSGTSPFFVSGAAHTARQRSPSPSKENIHLSYRKGASQIFGTRPNATPRSTASSIDGNTAIGGQDRRGSVEPKTAPVTVHRKSPSLSSIDSGNSHQSRRRSATTAEITTNSSPLAHEVKAATIPRVSKPPNELRTIDTSLESPSGIRSPPESALSPTKSGSELAAEARRERKVLDLEISNSSLLAINSSLEREVKRQKAELKRFRRLSRAGRFSIAPGERSARFSEGLSAVGEENEEENDDMFGPPSGLSELYDDMSDDDDEESLCNSAEAVSPSAQSRRESDRLAKDEKRLRVDLEKHKELLVHSQMMNQSIKRCMYATEDMIREGKKALDYHVRVSDVKLGGRVLSSHEDNEEAEIEVDDQFATQGNGMEQQAKGFLDVWSSIGRPSFESSEGGDRDSGIEVDRPPNAHASLPMAYLSGSVSDSGRPPGGSGLLSFERSGLGFSS